MNERPQSPAIALEDFDFDAVYQGRPPVEGGEHAFDVVPWDIGEPQPAIVRLEESGRLRGAILDAGCGLGENALFLAERGHRVTGVDSSPTAIERARERAAARGVDVRLEVADVTRLDGLDEPGFATVLDSALYHCLGDEQRTAYAAALHRVTAVGAHLHLFCFADAGIPTMAAPMAVSRDDLRAHLGGHWDIRSVELTDFATAFTPDSLHGQAGALMASLGLPIDGDALRLDEHGRLTIPVWYLEGVRR